MPNWKSEYNRDVYGRTITSLGDENKNIVVLDADLSKSTRTEFFAHKHPGRFFNMGISEQDMMGTAAGFAAAGKIPFVSTFAIFASGRAWEQVRNTICYCNLNVRIVVSHAGLSVGEDGASHQALEDIGLMRCIPNLRVIVPADAVETEQVIRYAAGTLDGPYYIRLGRSKTPIIFDENYRFALGKAPVLREGKDVTLFSTGILLSTAILAADILEKEGISARVVNMSTIKPIDRDAIAESAERTKGFVTIEEHSVIGGLGSAVSEVAVTLPNPPRMEMAGIQGVFGESGTPDELFRAYRLTPEEIALKAKKVLSKA